MPINDYPPQTSAYQGQGRSSTTIRQVPQKCQVCKGLSKAKKADCEPCDGKGWLMVTETETSWDPDPTYIPNVYPQPYVPPAYPPWPPTPTVIPGPNFCKAS